MKSNGCESLWVKASEQAGSMCDSTGRSADEGQLEVQTSCSHCHGAGSRRKHFGAVTDLALGASSINLLAQSLAPQHVGVGCGAIGFGFGAILGRILPSMPGQAIRFSVRTIAVGIALALALELIAAVAVLVYVAVSPLAGNRPFLNEGSGSNTLPHDPNRLRLALAYP